MGARYSEGRIYQVSAQAVMNELRSMQFCQMQGCQFLNTVPAPGGASFWYRRGMTMTSWGEKICVTVSAVGPYSTQISVHSECAYAGQLVDWGQNRNNVLAIYTHLERMVMGATLMPAPAPAPQPTRRCPYCQNVIAGGAQFCSFCGHSV